MEHLPDPMSRKLRRDRVSSRTRQVMDRLSSLMRLSHPAIVPNVLEDWEDAEKERTFPIPLKGRPGPHACMPNSTASRVVFTRSLPWSSYIISSALMFLKRYVGVRTTSPTRKVFDVSPWYPSKKTVISMFIISPFSRGRLESQWIILDTDMKGRGKARDGKLTHQESHALLCYLCSYSTNGGSQSIIVGKGMHCVR
jgi:hypothetical protein